MKKVIAAMVVMFTVVILLGGVWGMILQPITGGGAAQSFVYPIYVGLILLAGFVAGAAVVLYEEIHELREEIKCINKYETKQE